MFFVWSQKRINVKLAWWGPPEGGKTTTIHALAAEIDQRTDDSEPAAPVARGMPRNAQPVEVDEPDTRFTTYFCHPPDPLGEFSGWPLHYQCKCAEQPLQDNTAVDKVLDGVSAVVFVADAMRARQSDNEEALRDLVDRLSARHDIAAGTLPARVDALFGAGGPLRLVLQVNKVDQLGALPPQRVRRGLLLDESVPTVETLATDGEGVWQTFEAAAEALRPLLETAQERGRIPAAPTPE